MSGYERVLEFRLKILFDIRLWPLTLKDLEGRGQSWLILEDEAT